MIAQADQKFDVILADPPWSFRVWSKDNPWGGTAERHYPTMRTEEIAALPVGGLAEDNAALFLWAVWPSMPEALEIVDAWGFEYKTCAYLWAKAKPSGFGFWMGMDYYSRANTEPCLLAVRGSMPVTKKDVLALIYSPRREHSRKPDEQYGKIERLYPDARKLELFARRPRDGWSVWGNEVESDIQLITRVDAIRIPRGG